MRVEVEVEEIDLDGDYVNDEGDSPSIPSLCLTCTRCNHSVEVYGDSSASMLRGMVMLREECPRQESNFYVAKEL